MSRVSVYLSSYDHARFLPHAIESVLGQSYSDFELFIVDDASTDLSWDIIQGYQDPRIRAIRNPVNRNDKIVMCEVLSGMASGEYIAIHHSDNIWEPEKLKEQVDYLDSHPQIGAVFTRAQVIDEDDLPLQDQSHFFYRIFDQPNRDRHAWLNHFFYHSNALCHPSVLIRRTVYDACGYYRGGFQQLPDLDMWVRVCLKYQIHVIPKKLVRYRVMAGGQFTSADRPENHVRANFETLCVLQNYLEVPTFEEMVRIFPAARKYFRPGGWDSGYVLGRVALDTRDSSPMFCLFGLNLLFDALQDPARARQVESLYGFRQKDLAALTGHYDVFSLQNNPDSDVRRLASWLARLRDTLAPPNSTRNRVLKEFFKYIQYPFKKIR